MQWKPGMFDTPVVLNLQYFKRESYISVICQAIDFAVEGRKADADTHLAGCYESEYRNRHFGEYTKDKRQSFLRLSFFGYKGREERKENCGDGIKSITVSI